MPMKIDQPQVDPSALQQLIQQQKTGQTEKSGNLMDQNALAGISHSSDSGTGRGLMVADLLPLPKSGATETFVQKVRDNYGAKDAGTKDAGTDGDTELGDGNVSDDNDSAAEDWGASFNADAQGNVALAALVTLGTAMIQTNQMNQQSSEKTRDSALMSYTAKMADVRNDLESQGKSALTEAWTSGLGEITSGAMSTVGAGIGLMDENTSWTRLKSLGDTAAGPGVLSNSGKLFSGSFSIGAGYAKQAQIHAQKQQNSDQTLAEMYKTQASNDESFRGNFQSNVQSVIQAVGQLVNTVGQANAKSADLRG